MLARQPPGGSRPLPPDSSRRPVLTCVAALCFGSNLLVLLIHLPRSPDLRGGAGYACHGASKGDRKRRQPSRPRQQRSARGHAGAPRRGPGFCRASSSCSSEAWSGWATGAAAGGDASPPLWEGLQGPQAHFCHPWLQ